MLVQVTVTSTPGLTSIGNATSAAQLLFSTALVLHISARDAMMSDGIDREKLRTVAA